MRLIGPAMCLLLVAAAASCSEQSVTRLPSTGPSPLTESSGAVPTSRAAGTIASAASHMTATMQFGKPNVGTTFPPGSGHDGSAHAIDDVVPRTVVIDKGGKVTFNTFGVHQVAIYDDGTKPGDIDTTVLKLMPAGCPRPGGVVPLLIDDAENRVAIYEQPCGPAPRTVEHTFDEPGTYLVICAFLPHFEVQMYGWVRVRE